jgi:hypothetical protein
LLPSFRGELSVLQNTQRSEVQTVEPSHHNRVTRAVPERVTQRQILVLPNNDVSLTLVVRESQLTIVRADQKKLTNVSVLRSRNVLDTKDVCDEHVFSFW